MFILECMASSSEAILQHKLMLSTSTKKGNRMLFGFMIAMHEEKSKFYWNNCVQLLGHVNSQHQPITSLLVQQWALMFKTGDPQWTLFTFVGFPETEVHHNSISNINLYNGEQKLWFAPMHKKKKNKKNSRCNRGTTE